MLYPPRHVTFDSWERRCLRLFYLCVATPVTLVLLAFVTASTYLAYELLHV